MVEMGSIKWLTKYLVAHPLRTLFVLFSALVEPIFFMIPLFISADIVGILVTGGGWTEIWPLFRILIPISIFQVVFFFLSAFINEILAHRVTTDITRDLFQELQDRSLSYHDSKSVGDIMARASNDTRTINMGLSPGLRIFLALFSVWIVSQVIVFQLLPFYLVVLGQISFLIFIYLIFIYARGVEPLSTQALEELSDMSSISNDTLIGIREIKAYTSEHLAKARFAKITKQQALTKEREGRAGAWFYPSLIIRFYLLAIIGFSIIFIFDGRINIRDMVLVITVMSVVAGMADEMNWVSFLFVGTLAANTRLYAYISEIDPYRQQDGKVEFGNLPASISFDHVSFKYPDRDNLVLDNISFRLNDSETLAIVGSPGSGKSTLTKLIQRLYLPISGTIKLGGIDIREFQNNSLRKRIATVEQDVFLFNDTIEENIKFARPDATLDEVIEVAKIAQAHEFIMSFPDKYQTILGEDGVRVSGGQAQRIAIARAIMVNPEFLIFDDGASALDARTEKLIQESISEILKTRTTLITTHRLAIIAQADKVLILDKGKIVGFGTHEMLIKQNLYYRNLFERHFELPALEETV